MQSVLGTGVVLLLFTDSAEDVDVELEVLRLLRVGCVRGTIYHVLASVGHSVDDIRWSRNMHICPRHAFHPRFHSSPECSDEALSAVVVHRRGRGSFTKQSDRIKFRALQAPFVRTRTGRDMVNDVIKVGKT